MEPECLCEAKTNCAWMQVTLCCIPQSRVHTPSGKRHLYVLEEQIKYKI